MGIVWAPPHLPYPDPRFLYELTEAQTHESGEETTPGWEYESFSVGWLWGDMKGGGERWRKKMSQKKEIYVVWRAYSLFFFLFLFCPDVFQMGSYFGYAVAATDINNDGWVTPAATVGTDDRKNAR